MTLRKIELMHKLFGICQDKKCPECGHWKEWSCNDRRLMKCDVYGMTNCEATDWRKKYDACGLFNAPYVGKPIVTMVRANMDYVARKNVPGQVSMEV
jgi:hypothetical protein